MGCITSKPDYFDSTDGDGAAYKERWEEGKVLGEGEFGQVKIVTDQTGKVAGPLAMKELKKGFQWKDNTLYEPMKPEALRTEVNCLKNLRGDKYNLKLEALYETPSSLYIITEMCSGGEMLDYLTGTMKDGLRTEDISRISYQLLSAVDHCAKHGIIHRDIKPENTMFKTNASGAELRLIDFGCATLDGGASDAYDALVEHKTFAGTPFYISPEVFHNTYTSRADVWSAGATLVVLVAGYPADNLQKAFNMLQKGKNRNLKKFPGMPDDMPETYFEMLDGLLAYQPKNRKSAGEMLNCEFVKFHKDLEGDKKAERPKNRRTQSILFSQTGMRHGTYMSYKKFERAVTTILATVPSREELQDLLKKLGEYKDEKMESFPEEEEEEEEDGGGGGSEKLKVIKIGALEELLMEMGLVDVSTTIENLPNSSQYDDYSYPVEILHEFARKGSGNAAASGVKRIETTADANDTAGAGPPGQKGNRRQRFSLIVHKPTGAGGLPARGMNNKNAMSMRF